MESTPSDNPIEGLEAPQGEAEIIGIEARRQIQISTPIAPPQMLKEYEDIQAGFADRVLTYGEEDRRDTVELRRKTLELVSRMTMTGTIALVLIVLILVGGALAIGIWVNSIAATIVGAPASVPVFAALYFLYRV